MDRTPEPELMLGDEQAAAYATADFSEPHNLCIQLLQEKLPRLLSAGRALDLGCGPGDISRRFVKAFPDWSVDGVDGSSAMLELGEKLNEQAGLETQIKLIERYLPTETLPHDSYDLIFSNSLLHHLANPQVLWESISHWSQSDTSIFVMDLLRPESKIAAQALVAQYAAEEPEVLRTDFYNSLLAAYRVEEVATQLAVAGLTLQVEQVTDRHIIAWGCC